MADLKLPVPTFSLPKNFIHRYDLYLVLHGPITIDNVFPHHATLNAKHVEGDCPICYGPMDPNSSSLADQVVTLHRCEHIFHSDWLADWFQQQANDPTFLEELNHPTCRTDFITSAEESAVRDSRLQLVQKMLHGSLWGGEHLTIDRSQVDAKELTSIMLIAAFARYNCHLTGESSQANYFQENLHELKARCIVETIIQVLRMLDGENWAIAELLELIPYGVVLRVESGTILWEAVAEVEKKAAI